MAESLFDEELDEENRRRQLALERRLKLAPPDITIEGESFAIPGPPTPELIDRGENIRRDVARDILANPSGDETPEFLNKVRREAGFESDNVALPANQQSGFTPPPEIAAPPTGRELEFQGGRDYAAEGLDRQGINGGGPGEFVADLGRNALALPGRVKDLFPQTQEAVAGAESRLIDVLESEEEFGGEPSPRTAGEQARLGVGAGIDVAAAAGGGVVRDITTGVKNTLDTPIQFAGGLFGTGFDDGPQTVHAAEVEDEAVEPKGSKPTDTQGDVNTADASQAAQQDRAIAPTPGGLEDAVPPTAVSDQPGVESGIGGRTTADRLLGPPLTPERIAEGGTEIIRGVRRSFQPGEAGTSEIPFGAGTLERFKNAGMTIEQAGEMAIQAEQSDAALINAGANELVAQTNAVIDVKVPIRNADGTTTRGLLVVDPSAPGGIRIVPTDLLQPIGDDLIIATDEQDITDPLGNTIKLRKPMFLRPVEVEGEIVLRQVPVDSRQQDARMIQDNPALWDLAMQQAVDELGLPEGSPEQSNAALELLREHVLEQ